MGWGREQRPLFFDRRQVVTIYLQRSGFSFVCCRLHGVFNTLYGRRHTYQFGLLSITMTRRSTRTICTILHDALSIMVPITSRGGLEFIKTSRLLGANNSGLHFNRLFILGESSTGLNRMTVGLGIDRSFPYVSLEL